MNFKKILNNTLLICLILSITFNQVQSNKQNGSGIKKVKDMNILMPQIYDLKNERVIRHELEAYNGCYKWSSSNNHHINLKQNQLEACQNVCDLTLKSSDDLHNVIWITAQDQQTQDELRIETNIRKIHRIEILTKFRTIDVGDTQIIELIGFDEQGNSFSSLEGVKFEWSIEQLKDSLSFKPLKESQIQTTSLRKELESFFNPFFYTDVVAVEGKQTGKTVVTVKLQEQGYQTIIQDSVVIHVVEQFVIFPYEPLRLLKNNYVNYQLFYKPKSTSKYPYNTYREIKLPNNDYNWGFNTTQVNDSKSKFHKEDFATLYSDQVGQKLEGTLDITKSVDGWKNVIVKDMRSDQNTVQVKFTVSEPHHIDFQIKEHQSTDFLPSQPTTQDFQTIFENSLHLVKGRQYYIRTELYDKDNQLIYITPNTELQFKVDTNYFKIEQQLYRGQIVVTPIKLGKALDLTVTLKNYPNIQKQKQAQIVLPLILLSPPSINLPIGELLQQQTYYFQYFGGSQEYSLQSNDPSIIAVAENGRHVVAQNKEGQTEVQIFDRNNDKNFVNVKVSVSHVNKVVGLEKEKEVFEYGDDYIFPVALNNRDEQYHNCTVLNFEIIQNDYLELKNYIKPQSYDNLIESLQEESNNFTYMKQLLQIENLEEKQFYPYIEDKQVTLQELQQKWRYINNSGVCQKSLVRAQQQGQGRIQMKSTIQSKNTITNMYSSFALKVFKPYSNVWNNTDILQNLVKEQQIFEGIKNQKHQYSDKIVLAFGSSFEWNIQGGVDIWPNRSNQSNIKVHVEGGKEADKNGLITWSNSKETANNVFTCAYPYKLTTKENNNLIILESQNDADLLLPKPLKVEHSIQISCNVPQRIHIYNYNFTSSSFTDEYREKLSSQDMIYIKNEQISKLKVKAFDSKSQPFYRYESLKFTWTLSNQNYGNIKECLEDSHKGKDFEDLKQLFQATKTTSENNKDLILYAQTSTFKHSSLTFGEVQDQVGLKILRNVYLVPDNMKLYYYQNLNLNFTYDVSIQGGYGPFSYDQMVSGSSGKRILNVKRVEDRLLSIQPKQLGGTQIFVDDYKTLGSERAVCDIEVMGVEKLIINLKQQLIPQFNTTKLELTATTNQGDIFHYESYKYMDIHFEVEYSDKSQNIQKEELTFKNNLEVDNVYNIFDVQGKRQGIYRITAILSQHGQTILKSNSQELEIYPELWTDPSIIRLAPGCEFGLDIRGGPKDLSTLIMDIPQQLKGQERYVELLEVKEKRLFIIKAKEQFSQNVQFVLKQKINSNDKESYRILSTLDISLHINDITRVAIGGAQSNSRTLHLGTQIRLIAELYDGDNLMSMQLCDNKIEWESESENYIKIYPQENIYPAQSVYQNIQHQKNFQLAINTSAIDTGKSMVQFTLWNKNGYEIKSAAKQIEVIPHLGHSAPTYIAQDDVEVETVQSNIIIPPNSRYTIVANKKDLQFSFLNQQKNNDFELSSNGEIFAKTNKQKVGTTVTIYDKAQDDQMYINIQTADIASIFVQNSHTIFKMAQESQATLNVVLQDTLGRSFPVGLKGVNLSITYTNPKVVEASIDVFTQKLQIQSKTSGYSLIKVYLTENPQVYDIFRVNVGSVINPVSPVSVLAGGYIQFTTSENVISKQSYLSWKSKDTSVLSIGATDGQAQALKYGETIVEVNDGIVVHQARVLVSKIKEIVQSVPLLDNILTDMESSQYYQHSYKLPFDVYQIDPNGNKSLVKQLIKNDKKKAINNNLIFDCNIENKRDAQWFEVKAQTEYINGEQKSYCLIDLPSLQQHQQSTQPAPDSITLTVTLQDQEGNIRFQQRFEYNLRWMIKSRSYNENQQFQQQQQNRNQNNQQNNNSNFNNQQNNQNNDDQEEVYEGISWVDHITIICLLLGFVYYKSYKSSNSLDFGSIIIVIGLYFVYCKVVDSLF